MLVRPRLLDRLRARWFTPVTVVSAPAGYGKTTVLAQAMATNAAAPLGIDRWWSCEPGVGTASALGEGLGAALEVPAAGGATDPAGIVSALSDAIWQAAPQQVVLLVDDVQEVVPQSEAARVLGLVAANLPANGHLVLSGRGPPPVSLARIEVAGGILRLGVEDLAFTPEEVTQFAALRGVEPSVVAGCAGWPALAELSASALPGATADYVGQEILDRLDHDRRRALGVLAALGPFDEELARAVLGADVDVAGLLDDLPLVDRRGPGQWSLHALWQPLLAGAVRQADLAEARRRAAVVFRRRGQSAKAVRLLLDANAGPDVAAAVVDVLGAAHPPVSPDVLAEWLTRLDDEIRPRPPGRLLAAVVTAQADPDAAVVALKQTADEFRAAGDHTGELACLVQIGQIAWWAEDTARLAWLATRLFQLEALGSQEAIPLACLGRAMVVDIQNDSRAVLAELDRIPAGSLGPAWQGVVMWFRAISLMHLGDATASFDAAERALQLSGPLHIPLTEAAWLQARWFLGDVDEVRRAFPELVERMARAGFRTFTALAAAQSCVILAGAGEPERAAAYLARAQTTGAPSDTPLIATNMSLARAAIAVADGDEAEAAALLATNVEQYPLHEGHSAAPQQRCLALYYVLLPACRPAWDEADLGPVFAAARELARALVAVREQGRLPRGGPPLAPAGAVRALLPRRWVAELATAAIAADREDGWPLIESIWPGARPVVAELAQRGPRPLRATARTLLRSLATPPSGRLKLRVLGPLELLRDGAPVQALDWRRERVRLLLCHLVLHRTTSRGQLADDLWPDLDPVDQSRNLRVTLSYVLHVLEPERSAREPSFFLRQHGDRLTLHPGEYLDVDLWTFDDHAEQATRADRARTPAVTLDHALRAVELWRSEPPELVSQPWALAAIEHRRLTFATLATRAGELLLAQGNPDSAHALAERALAADPWMEAPHRLLVATHRAQGDDLAARRALERYRTTLDDLGLSPEEGTQMVERLVLDPGAH
jgi:DNA-binding SARP family transcriptional activator